MAPDDWAWPPIESDQTDPAHRIRTHVTDGVGIIVMDRPDRRNALDMPMREAIIECLLAWRDDPAVRVVVLTGIGKGFAAGADLRELLARSPEEQRTFVSPPHVYGTVWDFPGPVIACINGHALGAGSELMLACDVRIMGDRAKVGQPEVGLGLIPGGGGTQRLPRLVGYGRAMELVLSGRLVDATEAERIGYVERVVPQDQLHEETLAFAKDLATKSPVALQAAKRAMQAAWALPLAEGLQAEVDGFMDAFSSADAREGISAFLERRKPDFSGQ